MTHYTSTAIVHLPGLTPACVTPACGDPGLR
jgi:hypothetical protein